jgi:hypothetical protein
VVEFPFYLFRNWAAQLDAAEHQEAVRGLGRCDWAAYGFQLESVSSNEGESGAAAVLPVLPQSGPLKLASPYR